MFALPNRATQLMTRAPSAREPIASRPRASPYIYKDNKIITLYIPLNSSHILQLLDVVYFGLLKLTVDKLRIG